MNDNMREILRRHDSSYEVMPYYVFLDERPVGAKPISKTVKAGFDIDVYSERGDDEAHPSPEYEKAYEALRKMSEAVARDTTDSCFVDVVPFNSTVYLDPKRNFHSNTLLRIIVRHGRGMEQAAGAPEELAVKKVQEQLDQLGVSPSKGS